MAEGFDIVSYLMGKATGGGGGESAPARKPTSAFVWSDSEMKFGASAEEGQA